MTPDIMKGHVAKISIETATKLTHSDLQELCDATEEAIEHDGGFGWLKAPTRKN